MISVYACMSMDREIHIDGLVQERHNSIANKPELRLSCTNPSTCAVLVRDISTM